MSAPKPPAWLGFTTTSLGGLLGVLKNQCAISQAFDPVIGGTPQPAGIQPVQFDAIWDTGATNSCITQAVIDACGLLPIGMAQVTGVGGTTEEEVFLVNVYLPNHVAFSGLRVTRGKFVGADILIGMDIISNGDFAVTNYQGVTKFSFRVPSQRHIDYVQEHEQAKLRAEFHHGGKKNRPKRPSKTSGKNKRRK